MTKERKRTLNALVATTKEVGNFLRENAFKQGTVEWKKIDDPVTKLDRAAEQKIRDLLTRDAPGNFIGEEYGKDDRGLPTTYHIDPIDGTKSFILRDFTSSISLGIEEDNELEGGVVYDFMKDIMYVGYHGDCFLVHQGRKHDFKDRQPLSKLRLSIDISSGIKPKNTGQYSVHERKGSIALGMAELAAGNYDGMVSTDIGKGHSWDVAAGCYLLKARGFNVYDAHMRPFDYKDGKYGIIAIRPDVEEQVLSDLNLKKKEII